MSNYIHNMKMQARRTQLEWYIKSNVAMPFHDRLEAAKQFWLFINATPPNTAEKERIRKLKFVKRKPKKYGRYIYPIVIHGKYLYWKVQVWVSSQQNVLGTFKKLKDAITARDKFISKLK